MSITPRRAIGVALVTMMSAAIAPANTQAQTSGLKIVIIEGEDAVNIIQQKTAVAPVVEVRDRNNQPVAGAVVRFAIQGGRASFNGARTLSVTTNVAGRAAVSGLTPTTSGAFQITASAALNGQTAAVTIAQTNVMTAAQAAGVAGASAGSSGGASAVGAGGGAGGGGGVSATTIGIIGGAAAGGAIAAKEVLGGGEADMVKTYTGPLSGQFVETISSVGPPSNIPIVCVSNRTISGMMTIRLDADGTIAGDGETSGTVTET
jgi:hypothetical protein